MHQGDPSCIRLHDSSSRVLLQKNTLPLPITMAKSSLLPYPYSIIIHYYPVYRVYLPFYRVKNPISPSLSWVFRLTPSYPTPTIAWPLPRRYHCSMNIGAGDPTRPIPPSLDVVVLFINFYVLNYILHFFVIIFSFCLICFLTRGFVRPR